jgi:spore coat protein U-like protein
MRVKWFNHHSLNLALVIALGSGGFCINSYAGPHTAKANLNVSATVVASCIIGTYDQIAANTSIPLDVNGSVTTTCTNGSPVTVTSDQGSNPNETNTNTVVATVTF